MKTLHGLAITWVIIMGGIMGGLSPAAEDNILLASEQSLPDHLRVAFVREQELEIFPEPLLTAGELVIDRPRQAVRWHFEEEVTFILRGDELRRFAADGSEEAINLERDPGAQALKQQMIAFRDGDWSLLESFFTLTSRDLLPSDDDSPARWQLQLEPATEDLARLLSSIRVTLAADSLAPHEVVINNTSGDRTRYRFATPQTGEEFPEALFEGP